MPQNASGFEAAVVVAVQIMPHEERRTDLPSPQLNKGGHHCPEDVLVQIGLFLRAVKSEELLGSVNMAVDLARRRLYREALGVAAACGWDQLGAFVLACARLHPGRGDNTYERMIVLYVEQWRDLPGWFQDFLDSCIGHCTTSTRALASA